jgi:hypothetical protein
MTSDADAVTRDETTDDGDAVDPVDHLTEEEEDDLVDAPDTAATVSYSGQDFDVEGLVRRLRGGDIKIPVFGHQDPQISTAGFQRSFVWTKPQMDRFIESLLLGYPVPGIFLVRQKDNRYLVLDGQQRLRTLEHFFDGLHDGREFTLSNVATQFKALTYKSLPEDLRRQLDNTFFQATIVATDESSQSLEAIYQIFERVNSGGTQLTPHEIRVALFAGPFIDFTERLNRGAAWRALYGKKSPRLRDQELVLRIVALADDASSYKRPLKTFLNGFVAEHRSLLGFDVDNVASRFDAAADLVNRAGGHAALRPGGSQINSALTEAIFVALIRRIRSGHRLTTRQVKTALGRLGRDKDLAAVTSRATADEESVRRRLEIATAAFEKV